MKKCPVLNRNRSFITVFPSAQPLSLLRIQYTQSETTHSISWNPIVILLAYLQLCLPSDLIHSDWPIETLCSFLLSSTHTACSARLILLWFQHQNNIWWAECIPKLLNVQISPASCYFLPVSFRYFPQTTSAYVFPLMWETKFHIHIKQNYGSWFFFMFCWPCILV